MSKNLPSPEVAVSDSVESNLDGTSNGDAGAVNAGSDSNRYNNKDSNQMNDAADEEVSASNHNNVLSTKTMAATSKTSTPLYFYSPLKIDAVIAIMTKTLQEHGIVGSEDNANGRRQDALIIINTIAHLTRELRMDSSFNDGKLPLPDAMLRLTRLLGSTGASSYVSNFTVSSSGSANELNNNDNMPPTGMSSGSKSRNTLPMLNSLHFAAEKCACFFLTNGSLLRIALNEVLSHYYVGSPGGIEATKKVVNEITDGILSLATMPQSNDFMGHDLNMTRKWYEREPYIDYKIVIGANGEDCAYDTRDGADGDVNDGNRCDVCREDEWFQFFYGFKVVKEIDQKTEDLERYPWSIEDVFSSSSPYRIDFSSPQLLLSDICNFMFLIHPHYVEPNGSPAYDSDALECIKSLALLQEPHPLDSEGTIFLREETPIVKLAHKLHDNMLRFFNDFHCFLMSMILGSFEVWYHEHASSMEKMVGKTLPVKRNADGSYHNPDDYTGYDRFFRGMSLESKLTRESFQMLLRTLRESNALWSAWNTFNESKEVNPHYDHSDLEKSVDDHNCHDNISGMDDRNYEAPRALYYLHRDSICYFVRESSVCNRNAHLEERYVPYVDTSDSEMNDREMMFRQKAWTGKDLSAIIQQLDKIKPNNYEQGNVILGINLLKECSGFMDHPPHHWSLPSMTETIRCLRRRGTFVLARNANRMFNCFNVRIHQLDNELDFVRDVRKITHP